jgi:hypothetical protein
MGGKLTLILKNNPNKSAGKLSEQETVEIVSPIFTVPFIGEMYFHRRIGIYRIAILCRDGDPRSLSQARYRSLVSIVQDKSTVARVPVLSVFEGVQGDLRSSPAT